MRKLSAVVAIVAALALGGAPAAASAEEAPIHLPAPVQVDECGTENDRIETPEVDGVFYGVYDYTGQADWWAGYPADNYGYEAGDAVLVIATQDNWSPFEQPIDAEDPSGYDSAGSPGWWFPAFTDEPCEVAPTEVTPVRPKWSDPVGAGNAQWITTTQVGYHYEHSVTRNGRVRVDAVADPGFVFPEGVQTHWGRVEVNL